MNLSDLSSMSELIVDILEERDELHARIARFDAYTSLEAIQTELERRVGEQIPIRSLRAHLDILWSRREIVKLKGPSGESGYRSRIGELLRYIYKLKLWTVRGERERIYPDVSQVKYVRIPKLVPERVRPVEGLSSEIRAAGLSDLMENQYNINPVEIVAEALKQNHYEKFSDFQMRACRTLARAWGDQRSAPFVITAPTGGGKTMAFLTTPLILTLAERLRNPKDRGIGLLLVYPRNALALNQMQVVQKLVRTINTVLERKFEQKGLDISVPKLGDPLPDFQGIRSMQGRDKLREDYENPPEILITNTETLKRRLMDPIFRDVFRTIKCMVFDEIHIYEELHGTNVIFLIRRLKALCRKARGSDPVLIGASATIAEPSIYAKTIFSSMAEPKVLMPHENELADSGKEYHIFIRPYQNRPALSVAIDATSCVLHNYRMTGLAENKDTTDAKGLEKALAFADSLDGVNRWHSMLQSSEKSYKMSKRYKPNFVRFFQPRVWHDEQVSCCQDLTNGIDVSCPFYVSGQCWCLLTDDPNENYRQTEDRKYVKMDSIWSKTYTSKSEPLWSSSDMQARLFGFQYPPPNFADVVIATTALEVGVDFSNVKEIFMYRALRSPSSYRQRCGRAGREEGSHALVSTIVSPFPNELYFFRHFMNLVTPSFQPVPLKAINLEVIRNHLFCALFDLVAAEGLNIWEVVGRSDFGDEVNKAKNKVSSVGASYLATIYNDSELIQEAIVNFSRALDTITSADVSRWTGMKGSFVDVVTELYKNKSSMIALESSMATSKARARDANKQLDFIKQKRAECFDSLKTLEKHQDLRRLLFDILSELDKVLE